MPAPGAEERPLVGDAERRFQVIGIKDIVVVYEHEQLAYRLSDPPQASRRETDLILSNQPRLPVPRQIRSRHPFRCACVVDDEQLPPLLRERLARETLQASAQVLGSRVVRADDHGECGHVASYSRTAIMSSPPDAARR